MVAHPYNMQIKIKFPHEELCRRAAAILEVPRSQIVSVYATEGGKNFFVSYLVRGAFPWDDKLASTAVTIWQIIDALPLCDVSGSVETIWDKGLETMLEVLGLKSMPQSEKDLKRAYRKAAKRVHPDTGGNEDDFRQVNAAYNSVLTMLPNLRSAAQAL